MTAINHLISSRPAPQHDVKGRAAAREFGAAPEWMTLLARSERGGRDYTPRIEGELPPELNGVLYRNGPGLFERDGYRMLNMLDGDGLVQRLGFDGGRVCYRNAFVRTVKFEREQAAHKRLFSTWTTRRPGGFINNLGGGALESQGGVTAYRVNGKLVARDETGPSYEIDPQSLATRGRFDVLEGLEGVGFKAHSRVDPDTGEWFLVGQQFGPSMNIHIVVRTPDFALKEHRVFKSPRQVYFHDFFLTKRFLVFVLHPCEFSPFPFLAGLKSFTDSLAWRPDTGNIVAVMPRDGGAPTYFDAQSAWMWHVLNAYEENDNIVLDFVGYDEPDHFIGKDALFHNIMDGRIGRAESPGKVRRYIVERKMGRLREEVIDVGNHEFPMIDGRLATRRHRFGYYATGGLGAFNSGLKRIDYQTGRTDVYEFGSNVHVGEPVFAPRPKARTDEGWLIAQCLDGETKTTYFAILDARAIADGPVARVWLSHSVPISFHGAWAGR